MYSPEELRISPVIDLEELLRPISDENPAGESLRYTGFYDEISEARRADEDLSMGQWQFELKIADYRRVIELADEALKNQTKDLQIAVWFSEALSREKGFAGLRDSLKLIIGLQENFWETLFPEIDDGDMEARANALEALDKQTAEAIRTQPITEGENLNWLNWEESSRFDIPEVLDTLSYNDQERYRELKAQAEKENRITGEQWRKARTSTSRLFCERTNLVLNECWTEFENLDRVIEEKFERNQAPGLSLLKKALEEIQTQVKRLLDEKRIQEPDPESDISEEETTQTEISEDGEVVMTTGKRGAVQNRQDALKRLAEVAEYFRRNEPHSPVSYLVNRAVKWGNMPLETWLQDVIKDDSILTELRQTLGFNTGLEDEEASE